MAIVLSHKALEDRAEERGRARIIVSRPQLLSRRQRILARYALPAAATLAALFGLAIFGWVRIRAIAQHLPPIGNLADTRSHPLTTIVSSDGVLLATFETHYRRPVPLEQISPLLVDATLATEDARFYSHSGVDPRGIVRAAVSNLASGNWSAQGGSTITQQLARNLYLSNQKTLHRKIEEILLAREIERRFGKHDILEAYLNTIYYGNGCYGAEAAAQAYFHKSARALDLGEAALLAGLPQRPAAYSPIQHLGQALARRAEVLRRMVAAGRCTAGAAELAGAEPVHVYRPRIQSPFDWRAPYFVAHVLTELRDRFGTESLYSGMRVVTTLNWRMQATAEAALRRGLARRRGPNTGAIVTLDPRSGAIRALVGGPDFRRDQFDAATQGIRQPGSAFKPIVYAAAFDTNVCTLANQVDDQKLFFHDRPRDWIVHNYDGRYRGPVSVLEGIRQSINTVAVQVAQDTGIRTVKAYAEQLGIHTPLSPDLALALGASGVHPIDLCSAFSAFANQGARFDPYCIREVSDGAGSVTYRDDPMLRFHPSVMSQNTLDQINVALSEVVHSGTGMAASAVPDAHGKTGTTSSHRDAWFAGYTGELATVVWMAHVEKRGGGGPVTVRYLPMPGATGGVLCAPVWAVYMRAAQAEQSRVDLATGTAPAVVVQPTKQAMIERLQQSVPATAIEEAKRADQEPAPAETEADPWASENGPAATSVVFSAAVPVGYGGRESQNGPPADERTFTAARRDAEGAEATFTSRRSRDVFNPR
jgi:penicillin-binding protein 1A